MLFSHMQVEGWSIVYQKLYAYMNLASISFNYLLEELNMWQLNYSISNKLKSEIQNSPNKKT